MGALGCSDGHGPGSVVGAFTATGKTPTSAKARIAKPAIHRFFMITSYEPSRTHFVIGRSNRHAKCWTIGSLVTLLFSARKMTARGLAEPWRLEVVAGLSQVGGFQPVRAGMARNTKAPIVNRGLGITT